MSKYLPRRRKPPSQTWRSFLENHVDTLVSVDFFTVPTVFFHVLFVFVVLAHDRRRILSINVTSNPSAAWTGNQVVQTFPCETAPRLYYQTTHKPRGSRPPVVAGPPLSDTIEPWQSSSSERSSSPSTTCSSASQIG